MILEILICLAACGGITLGLAWPLASRLALNPAEQLGASLALSLLGVFLFAWVVYVASLPVTTLWALPGLATAGLLLGRRALAATLRDADARALVAAQLIITVWCVGWLALVLSYSGGGWAADWWGHLQRTWLFLEHWPRHILFNSFDALTSRPPLGNIVNGAFIEITQKNFRHYQLFSTLLASLAFWPAALLARRFGGRPAIAVLAVLFMLNPMFAQNATYPWTKLPTAFFVLSALYFFLRTHDTPAPGSAGMLFSLCLAAGLLTHYSAGPYAVFLALAWLGLGWARYHEVAWQRTTAFAAVAGLLLLATWFGWALMVYGWHGTFLTNTSVTDQAPTAGGQLRAVALNLRDTFVPHFLRPVDFSMFAQPNPTGWWRDWFFNLYQTNFFFCFGSVAWIAILSLLIRNWPGAATRQRIFWMVFVTGTALLGVAVHAARDTFGLAHICLQPLVLLGLAFLAAHWPSLGRWWRGALAVGAAVDFSFGIGLQFWVQSDGLSRRFTSGAVVGDHGTDYSQTAQMNLYAKLHNHWVFVGDLFAPHAVLVSALLIALFSLAVIRARRAPTAPIPHP